MSIDAEKLKAEGWRCHIGTNFNAAGGPFWMLGRHDTRVAGLIVEEKHTNNAGKLHGGALMTFADIALGSGAADSFGHNQCVTAQLALQFVSGAKVGEFITCKPEVVRHTKSLVFVRGLFIAGDRTIASADGIWKAFDGATAKP